MNPYEILLMFDPELADERQSEIVRRMRESVEQAGGTWAGHERWGTRRLAYEIAGRHDGVYHLVAFDTDAATLDELSRVLRITDGVMRHMPTRRLEQATQPAAAGPEPQSRPVEQAEPVERAEPAVGTPE